MPRDKPMKDESDDDEGDYSTDSDGDYFPDVDLIRDLQNQAPHNTISEAGINEAWKKQRGVCRITEVPFGAGLYAPALERRKMSEDWSDQNLVVVLMAVKTMRESVNLPWRAFTRLLTMVGREPDL